MPFIRKKRGLVQLVHNRRSLDGKVRQEVLYAFSSPDELAAMLEPGAWSRFRETLSWRHKELRWDWRRIRAQLDEQLERWSSSPSGAALRRGSKVRRLAGELALLLGELSPARAGDAAIIGGSREELYTLRAAIDRLHGVAPGPAAPREAVADTLTSTALDEADAQFDAGMELWWAGERAAACRHFRKALKVHPGHADVHNHLGIYCLDRGRVKDAGEHFEAAIEGGTRELVSELGEVSWGHLENRPYLRGLFNLALVRSRQRRYEEEAELYEKLLRLNPNDNQGARYVVGEAYLRLGRLEEAIRALGRAQDEPGCCYGLALALHEAGQEAEAGLALVRAFAANRYVPPMLLGEPWEHSGAWHASTMAEPEWAADYLERQGDLWRRCPGSAELLQRWWRARPVQAWLSDLAALRQDLASLEVGEDRSRLVSRVSGLESESMIRVVAAEVDPEAVGGGGPYGRPRVASPDEVRISREDGGAVIEHANGSVGTVHLQLEGAEDLSDAEILEAYNETVLAMEAARAAHEHVAVEIPPGRPQIEFDPSIQHWVSRGDVLRCTISDHEHGVQVNVDGRELSQEELGQLLAVYSGWGMRIVFVPDDELDRRPVIEVREPADAT